MEAVREVRKEKEVGKGSPGLGREGSEVRGTEGLGEIKSSWELSAKGLG